MGMKTNLYSRDGSETGWGLVWMDIKSAGMVVISVPVQASTAQSITWRHIPFMALISSPSQGLVCMTGQLGCVFSH